MSIDFSAIEEMVVGYAPIKSETSWGAAMYNEKPVTFKEFIGYDIVKGLVDKIRTSKNENGYISVHSGLLEIASNIEEERKSDAKEKKNLIPYKKMERDSKLEILKNAANLIFENYLR